MNQRLAREISEEVFQGWASILGENQSTPLLLLGGGHGPKSGELHICVRNDPQLTREVIRGFLIKALLLMEDGPMIDGRDTGAKAT